MDFDTYYQVSQTLNRYGHMLDSRAAPFDSIFTSDAVMDLTPVNGPVAHGLEEILTLYVGSPIDPFTSSAPPGPAQISHHVTNIEFTAEGHDWVDTRCKYIRLHVAQAAVIDTGIYQDRFTRTSAGWRIRHRTVSKDGVLPQ